MTDHVHPSRAESLANTELAVGDTDELDHDTAIDETDEEAGPSVARRRARGLVAAPGCHRGEHGLGAR
mgnify:CR=1 FL=1